MSKNKTINAGGINGLGTGLINLNSNDFKELRRIIKKSAESLKEEKRIENQLLSIRFRMEEYLNQAEPKEIIPVGNFLKEFFVVLKIKNIAFAEYIGYESSNLSAILNGRRKINPDLAIKFGIIFQIDPVIWLHIQNKNELLELKRERKESYDHYRLDDLLRKAS